jgi:hypothetical protein
LVTVVSSLPASLRRKSGEGGGSRLGVNDVKSGKISRVSPPAPPLFGPHSVYPSAGRRKKKSYIPVSYVHAYAMGGDAGTNCECVCCGCSFNAVQMRVALNRVLFAPAGGYSCHDKLLA